MRLFATLLALGLICGAAADEDGAPGSAAVACVATPADFVANLEAKILREVRIAAGRLGRLTLWGADMWIKDQYVDIFFRWVYLPLYAILAAVSLTVSDV